MHVNILCEIGIIECAKRLYRTELVKTKLEYVYSHSKREGKFDIRFYDAVKMFVKCFYNVSVECITHCWRHTGIYTNGIDYYKVDADEEGIKNNGGTNNDDRTKLSEDYTKKYSNEEASTNNSDDSNNNNTSNSNNNYVSDTENENCDSKINLDGDDFQKIRKINGMKLKYQKNFK
jgi:hypothetical protein